MILVIHVTHMTREDIGLDKRPLVVLVMTGASRVTKAMAAIVTTGAETGDHLLEDFLPRIDTRGDTPCLLTTGATLTRDAGDRDRARDLIAVTRGILHESQDV